MNVQSGEIFGAMIIGVVLAAVVAWIVSGLYRRRMVALMRTAPPPDADRAGTGPAVAPSVRVSIRPDRGANRQATIRLIAALTGISVAVATLQAWAALAIQFQALTPARWLLLTAIYAWPMVLAWGLALRWPRLQVLAGIGIYLLLMFVLVMWRSNDQQSAAGVVKWLLLEVGVPLMVTLILGASGRIRAVAPYLLPPALVLSASSILALNIAGQNLDVAWPGLPMLLDLFGASGTMVVLALGPWVVLAWPVYAGSRQLAVAYRRKRFSDLVYLFAMYWFVVLLSNSVTAFAGVGAGGFALLAPWLAIPVAWWLLRGWLAPAGDAPNLLVLRVFQQDAQVEKLFDRVIERWRFTGNTLLIAGTDLVSRTLDPDDLFTFLDRQLAQRFVNNVAEIPVRLGQFDMAPDPDGRHRVNECYCRDSTWQATLAALVDRCDVVLMDLRGFQPHNQGCRYELGVLARVAHLRRVVVLYDGRTARPAAEADIAGAPAGRFLWIDAGRMNAAKARDVFVALFVDGPEGRGGTA